jgi:hypothetical protein
MRKHSKGSLVAGVVLLTLIISNPIIYCQNADRDVVAGIPVNYDEAQAGTYTLPDPLIFPNGRKVKNASQWYKKRRPSPCLRSISTGKYHLLPKIYHSMFSTKAHLHLMVRLSENRLPFFLRRTHLITR